MALLDIFIRELWIAVTTLPVPSLSFDLILSPAYSEMHECDMLFLSLVYISNPGNRSA